MGDACPDDRDENTSSTNGRSATRSCDVAIGAPLGRSPSSTRAREGRRSGWRALFEGLHPAIVFVVAMLAGLAAIAALSIGLGFFVTRVLEHAWGIGCG